MNLQIEKINGKEYIPLIRGKWLKREHNEWKNEGLHKCVSFQCSVCNEFIEYPPTKFCGECGALNERIVKVQK